MSNADDEQELAKFKAELPARQATLQAAKDEFKAREEREIFQLEAAAMCREQRATLRNELQDETRLLANKIQQRQKEVRRLESQQRSARIEEEVANTLATTPSQVSQKKPDILSTQEATTLIEQLKAESEALKNLIQQREQRIESLKQLNRQTPEPKLEL